MSAEAEPGQPALPTTDVLVIELDDLLVFDAETLRFLRANKSARANLGYTWDELSEMSVIDIKPDFTAEMLHQVVAPLIGGETERLRFETIHRRKDGSHYNVEVNLHLDEFEGRPAFVATVLDTTSRKRTEMLLREREELSRGVLETAPSSILIIDENGLIQSANPATEYTFGYALDELIGQNINMLMPSPFREEHDHYIASYLATGKKKIIGTGRQVSAQRRDGTVFPIELSVGEVQRSGGKHLFTGIIRDISERKALESKLLSVSEDERRMIGQEIHDDLCQRFFGIGCLIKAIQAQSDDLPYQFNQNLVELSRLVREANTRAREMAHGLMPVSLVSDGLMGALEDLAESTGRSSRIRCRLHCEAPVLIEDDHTATQLYRIAQEAVKNAVHHGTPQLIEIFLRSTGENIILKIRDDGTGLPGHSDRAGGLGLLTMEHRARTLGGTCEFRNHHGTIITCSIPVANLGPKNSGCPFPTST